MTAVCPKIAEEEFIITIDNLDALKLSTYERTEGVRVVISCLSHLTHVLNGTSMVTCLPTGQWDSRIPTCVTRQQHGGGNDDIITEPSIVDRSPTEAAYDMLPYIVALTALGLACILLMILLSYALLSEPKSKRGNCDRSNDTSRTASHVDFFLEMGPRHYRCHELASSQDTMVHNLRYTNLHHDWSGY